MVAMFGQGFDSPRLHKKDLIQLNEVFLFCACWQLIIHRGDYMRGHWK